MLYILIAVSLINGVYLRSIDAALKNDNHPKLMQRHERAQPQEEANRIWERAIAAKGGRERLHSINNVVISSDSEYRTSALRKNKIRQEELYVLPHKSWSWSDLRPDVFGLRVTMYNFDTNMKYVISEGEPLHQPEPIPVAERDRAEMRGLLADLLETKWLKPVLVGVSKGRIRFRPVDILETKVNARRVDFALDQKTHLPVRVSYHNVINGKTYITTVDLSDYVQVNGIMVPEKVKYGDGTEYKQTYRFNVEYNREIFIKPPPLAAGPEAWKLGNP